MTSNYSAIDVYKENNRVNKCQLHIQYTKALYYIISHLQTINCKEHIQMTSNYKAIVV